MTSRASGLIPVLVLGLVATAACTRKADMPPTPKVVEVGAAAFRAAVAPADASHRSDGIAWRRDDVAAAFAEARAAGKPVFLYWGASWCPPCNQMNATLFNRREFIERTRAFVPVYVDGDTPAAQRLGTRYSVSGYPTMVLFTSDGTEITRLPGEADPERYLQLLALGLASVRPVRDTLQIALGDGNGLTQDDWRMLAWYSWDTDDQQLVPTAQVAATLRKLADRCPPSFAEPRARLTLKTAASAPDAEAGPRATRAAAGGIDRAGTLAVVETVLASPTASREQFDLLTSAMPEIARAVTVAGSAERGRLVGEADRALAGLAKDGGLSNTDRLDATIARVRLATLGAPAGEAAPVALPDALRDTVVAEAARADRESRDPYERQTVINSAADLLAKAGMLDASDALLRAELARSHSPYYFMLDLAANARKRGDKAAALEWYGKAYDAAKGPATRLQWGSAYVAALIGLSPDDAGRIERAAAQVIGEIAPAPESFDGRNRKSLKRIGDQVAAWKAAGRHDAEAARIAEAAARLCGQVPTGSPERTRCTALLAGGTDQGQQARPSGSRS